MDMQKGVENLLDIRKLFDPFRKHLEVETNTRILFSGRFGIGKTYFLKKFFEEHKGYFCIHLHLASYQIATNEKITDYIKTDVMISILEKSDKRDDSTFLSNPGLSKWRLCNKALKQKWYEIALSVGATAPVVGKYIACIDTVVKKYGSVTEDSIKEELNKQDGKKVLLIDDLDRMDPEHIFRILNVFSSFVGEEDVETESDRLGFDTVICVCDIDNLRRIFSHRYGEKTDFNGYLDKYYSNNIYRYDTSETIYLIRQQIDKIISSFNIDEAVKKQPLGGYHTYLIHRTLQLGFQLKNNQPNLRILFKAVNHKIPALTNMQNNPTSANTVHTHTPNEDQIVMVNKGINALKILFGDTEVLLECVENIISENRHESEKDSRIGNANSVFAGLLFTTLQKKNLLNCKSLGTAGSDEKIYRLSLRGETFDLELRKGFLTFGDDQLKISTKLLYMLLFVYLDKNLEEETRTLS